MYIKRKLITAITLALGTSSPYLLAQEALSQAVDKSENVIDEVVTTASPIRDSQMAAIEAKRGASNVMEVIAADTIGRFPDQNLADSLGRVPGLAIERDQGQARYINFRGMPFRYTAIGFDGIDVPGAENGRIPRFDSFPSVITSRIEVNKAVLPSMTGEAVAGYINIETFNPFDQEGFAADLDIGIGQQSLGEGGIEKFGSRLSYSNEHFGAMAFYSKNSRDQITDNREYDLEPSGDSYVVNSIDMRSYKLTREDEAYGVHLEYRNDSGSRFFVSKLYSEFTDYEQRNQYVFNFAAAPIGPIIENSPVYINRLLEYGTYSNSTDTTTFGMDTQLNGWNIEARYNVTETEFITQLPIVYQSGLDFLNGYAADIYLADVDISNLEDPILTLSTQVDEIVYGATSSYAYKINSPMTNKADKYKLDVSKDFALLGKASTFSAGFEYNTRDVNGENTVDFDVLSFIPAYGGIELDINSYLTNNAWDSNTTNSINAMYWDNKQLFSDWKAAVGGDIYGDPSEEDLVAIEEDITALYAMMDTQFPWGNIVYGVRVEQTDYRSTGVLLSDEDGSEIAIDHQDSFTNVLPSIHLNYEIHSDLVARASISSGVNRPTYNEWRAAASVDPTSTPVTVSGGNPTLKAEESMGFDASLEYYFAPASILSASIFTRTIDNVIYDSVENVDGGVYNSSAVGEIWELSGPVNGSDGKLSGLEINFIGQAGDLVSALDGWGLSANATFMDSEFTDLENEKLDLPGTSDLIYNTSVFYENNSLSVRLNYQFRDEWISPIEDPSEYWGEQQRLDFNLQYQLPGMSGLEGASLYFNANNLTNETDLRYAGNGTVNQVESYGRQYLLGLRLSF
jgi:TonB-dependent receptor